MFNNFIYLSNHIAPMKDVLLGKFYFITIKVSNCKNLKILELYLF